MSRTHAARNLARAREWLLDTGREEAEVVWKTLWIAYGRASEGLVSMEEFLVTVQTLLEKGELVPVYHHLPVHVADVVQSPQQGLPPVTSRSEPSAPDEGSTFESDHAVPAQVSVLIAAASAGTPFCEVCNRAAQQPPPALTWKEKEKALHWIEIQLVGEDDSPVGNMKYRVRLPDGEIVTGTLNDNGFARLDRLEQSGTCEVCFPDLDKEAWTHVRTQG
jgi:hypothetical protein